MSNKAIVQGITKGDIQRIEDAVRFVNMDTWERRKGEIFIDRFTDFRDSSTKREIYQFPIDTSRIESLGNGGNMSYYDMLEDTMSITNHKFGAGLKMNAEDIEDSKTMLLSEGGPVDRAERWGREIGNKSIMFPQEEIIKMIKHGRESPCRDDMPFFSDRHWVNSYTKSGDTYSNMFWGVRPDTEGLFEVVRRMRSIKAPDGKFLYIRPSMIISGEQYRQLVTHTLNAQFASDSFGGSGSATAERGATIRALGFDEPTFTPDFDDADFGDSWLVVARWNAGDGFGPVIWQTRKNFSMNTFSHMSEAELNVMEQFRWHFKGRFGSAWGNPYLMAICSPKKDPNPHTIYSIPTDGDEPPPPAKKGKEAA